MLRFDQQVQLPTVSGADYVHDIVYDFYGTRLALCTSSLRISVYSAPSSGAAPPAAGPPAPEAGAGGWVEVARMERAHMGPIWRLSWGHPEYGEPLASCSEDRNVIVWYPGRSGAAVAPRGAEAAVPARWEARGLLQWDGPVVDVRFAPSALGPKLAACTADGRVRVWECVNALDLRHWESEDLDSVAQKPSGEASPADAAAGASAALDWMPAPFGGSGGERGEALAIGGRGRGRLGIWVKEKSGWKELASAEAHAGGVKDVAWCPNLCRPYEIVATCGAGAALWRVDLSWPQDDRYDSSGAYPRKESSCSCQLQLLKELVPANDEVCPVWRCTWSLTGTALALSPEGAEVSVWKADASLQWRRECDIDLAGGEEE